MSYIRRHNVTGIYWYRRAVPPHLRGHLPFVHGFANKPDRSEFSKTLRTRDPAQANRSAALIDAVVERAMKEAERAADARRGNSQPQAPSSSVTMLRPTDAFAAIANWQEHERGLAEMRVFSGDTVPSVWESAAASQDARYNLKQFASSPRSLPDSWKVIPGFDDTLLQALAVQGIVLPYGHPALTWLRPSFASAWSDLLRATEQMRQGLWEWGERTTTGQAQQDTTPFASKVEDWSAAIPMKDRQKSMYASDVRTFASSIPGIMVERLTKSQVQEWVTELRKAGRSAKTVRRKLSSLRNYWRYLQAHEIADRTNDPFTGLWLKGGSTGQEAQSRRGEKAFEPQDICKLWREALNQGQQDLANLIRIAAFTGGRIEAICGMKSSDLENHEAAEMRTVRMEDKTEAGRRDVPIHSEIVSLFSRLQHSADKDGYLIHTTTNNKNNERSTALGKKFGRLKTRLGFDKRYTFHSIRKTFTTLLERSGCPENVAADMLGHEKPTMTYGLYSANTSLDQRRHWLEAAIKYPDQAFMTGEPTEPATARRRSARRQLGKSISRGELSA